MSILKSVTRVPFAFVLLLVIVLSSGMGGAYIYYRHQAGLYEVELAAALAESQRRVDLLEKMVNRLTNTRTLAQIVVTGQDIDEQTGWVRSTTFLMNQLDETGEVTNHACLTIPGRVGFFDALVIKFDPDSVAAADPLRGHSLALLRRVYSEQLAPRDGFPLDIPGDIPPRYLIDEQPTEYERMLWDRFWDLAQDTDMADELGVRVVQGEAVYKPLFPGSMYALTLDSIGGLNLETVEIPDAMKEALTMAADKDKP